MMKTAGTTTKMHPHRVQQQQDDHDDDDRGTSRCDNDDDGGEFLFFNNTFHDFIHDRVDITGCRLGGYIRIGYALLFLFDRLLLGLDYTEYFHPITGKIPFRYRLENDDADLWTLFRYAPKSISLVYGIYYVGLLNGILLLFGIVPRLQVALLYINLVCLHHHNDAIWDGQDNMFRIWSFMLFFLPLHHITIYDRFGTTITRKKSTPSSTGRNENNIVVNNSNRNNTTDDDDDDDDDNYNNDTWPIWPYRIWQIDMTLVYIGASFGKLNSTTWINGTALYRVAHTVDFYPGIFNPDIIFNRVLSLKLICWIALLIESCCWWSIWIPSLRTITLIFVFLLHIGIDLSMNMHCFEWLAMLGWCVFFIKPAKKNTTTTITTTNNDTTTRMITNDDDNINNNKAIGNEDDDDHDHDENGSNTSNTTTDSEMSSSIIVVDSSSSSSPTSCIININNNNNTTCSSSATSTTTTAAADPTKSVRPTTEVVSSSSLTTSKTTTVPVAHSSSKKKRKATTTTATSTEAVNMTTTTKSTKTIKTRKTTTSIFRRIIDTIIFTTITSIFIIDAFPTEHVIDVMLPIIETAMDITYQVQRNLQHKIGTSLSHIGLWQNTWDMFGGDPDNFNSYFHAYITYKNGTIVNWNSPHWSNMNDITRKRYQRPMDYYEHIETRSIPYALQPLCEYIAREYNEKDRSSSGSTGATTTDESSNNSNNNPVMMVDLIGIYEEAIDPMPEHLKWNEIAKQPMELSWERLMTLHLCEAEEEHNDDRTKHIDNNEQQPYPNNDDGSSISCRLWAKYGECRTNPRFMFTYCPISCNQCAVGEYRSHYYAKENIRKGIHDITSDPMYSNSHSHSHSNSNSNSHHYHHTTATANEAIHQQSTTTTATRTAASAVGIWDEEYDDEEYDDDEDDDDDEYDDVDLDLDDMSRHHQQQGFTTHKKYTDNTNNPRVDGYDEL